MDRTARIVVGAALALLLGWNPAFLQGVAWCSMVVSYGQKASIKTAVSWTFDGKHSCKLCRLAQQTANDERQPRTIQPSVRMEAVIPAHDEIAVLEVDTSLAVFPQISLPESRAIRPILPPPRLGWA